MLEIIVPIAVVIAASGRPAIRAAVLVWWVRRGGDITEIEALSSASDTEEAAFRCLGT